jgi:hypothetical protein
VAQSLSWPVFSMKMESFVNRYGCDKHTGNGCVYAKPPHSLVRDERYLMETQCPIKCIQTIKYKLQ